MLPKPSLEGEPLYSRFSREVVFERGPLQTSLSREAFSTRRAAVEELAERSCLEERGLLGRLDYRAFSPKRAFPEELV